MVGRCSSEAAPRCWVDKRALREAEFLSALGRHGLRWMLLSLLLAALVGLHVPTAQGAAVERRCAGHQSVADWCIAEPFVTFWERHGCRDVFGLPLGPAVPLTTGAGNFVVQYFNNARLEWHPANPDPYRILLGRIGEERLKQLGQQDLSLHGKESKQDCRIFDTTRHKVCDGFLAYWRSHGLRLDDNERVSEQESIALLGLPLTAVQQEVDLSGKTVRTQWFERAQVIERNGVITRAPLGEHVMPPTEELSPFDGPPATPPVRVPPLGQAEPPVTQPTGPPP